MTIVRNESLDTYHARKGTVSASRLKIFRESPLLYRKTFIDGTVPREDTRALIAGRAFDCLLFDGRDAYVKQYSVPPKTYPSDKGEDKAWTMQANYCKAWATAELMHGRQVVDKNDAVAFEAMLHSIRSHPLAAALLGQGEPQVTFRRSSERFGLEVQVRPDWYSEKPIERPDLGLASNGLPYLLDLKTTADFSEWFDPLDPDSPRAGKPVHTYGYHRQGAMAQWCSFQDIGRTAHFLLVVEKSEPFRCGIVQLDDSYLELGWADVEADLLRLKNCHTTDVWPGSPGRVITLTPPQWLLDASVRQATASVDAGLPIGQQS